MDGPVSWKVPVAKGMKNDSPELVVTYRVDSDDRIVAVGGCWDEFATDNGLPGSPEALLGRPLREFVADRSTDHFYTLLLKKVRTSGRPVVFPFRCDAPDRRRYMEMTMTGKENGGVEFCSRILREEPRVPVAILQAGGEREGLLRMCSWCKQVPVDHSTWVEVEEALAALRLMEQPRLPAVTHTICPDCFNLFEGAEGDNLPQETETCD